MNCMAQVIEQSRTSIHFYVFYFIRYLDFKSSILHCSFVENIFLVKIQTNVNQRKHIHNNFLSEVSLTIKIQNFDHQNWSDFFGIRTYFSLPG